MGQNNQSGQCNPPPPFFRQSPHIYWFLKIPPKSQIFRWTPKILKFFVIESFFCHEISQTLIYFYVKVATPAWLKSPLLKVEALSSTPFMKIWLEAEPPSLNPHLNLNPAERGGGGARYDNSRLAKKTISGIELDSFWEVKI